METKCYWTLEQQVYCKYHDIIGTVENFQLPPSFNRGARFFPTPPIVLRMEEAISHADHTVRVSASARVGSPLNQMNAIFCTALDLRHPYRP